jgi:hypothetical protein
MKNASFAFQIPGSNSQCVFVLDPMGKLEAADFLLISSRGRVLFGRLIGGMNWL